MGNFLAVRQFIYVIGAIIDPNQNNPNENTIYGQHNASMDGLTGHGHTGSIGDGPKLGPGSLNLNQDWHFLSNVEIDGDLTVHGEAIFDNAPQVAPIGSIIPFYDFNALVTFNPTYWKYCDGTVIANVASPLNGQTAPDLSGRYLVGFGTDGGGDIGTAPWATPPVGNINHQINLLHAHSMQGHTHSHLHTHDLANHTHTGGSHNHGPGTLEFRVMSFDDATDTLSMFLTGGGAAGSVNYQVDNGGSSGFFGFVVSDGSGSKDFVTDDAGATGVTANGGTVATGGPSSNTSGPASASNTAGPSVANTDNQLSATQSIQPRSIRVRFIIRVL